MFAHSPLRIRLAPAPATLTLILVFWAQSCAVVIPCLNEAAAISSLVASVRLTLPTVIVIDDGSTDDTSRLAAAAGAAVLRHEQPKGKGASLRDGWRVARERGFTWALSMDGDGQHAVADIPKFLARAAQGDVALVCGNRMHRSSAMPFVRRCTNRFMSWRLSRLAGVPLFDTQCGFRLMQLESWARCPIHTDCFEVESEVLVEFARAGLGIAFVPIEVIYAHEQSKIRPLRDTVRWFRWLASLRQPRA